MKIFFDNFNGMWAKWKMQRTDKRWVLYSNRWWVQFWLVIREF